MKWLVSGCVVILILFTVLSCMPVHGEEEIYEKIIRLHVIAESDSEEDQARKLLVRDAVLCYLEDEIADAATYEEAESLIKERIPEICAAAEAVVEGKCSVDIVMGTEKYPVRYYENFTLPAGDYTSLRIILGEGAGKNWWCVLFPQLCTAKATEDYFYEDFIAAGFSAEQYRLIRNESGMRYKIRFKILEILQELKK